MKMETLLAAKELQNIKLIAGHQGLKRNVQLIGMIEAPDIESYLFADQLLVTTGYHYYQDVNLLKLLIKKMAAANCAGLGIKANRYFKKIPQDVIQLAESLCFPLLLTPAKESLSKTVSSLIKVVIQSDALKLSRVIQQNQRLSRLALNNTRFNIFLDQCAAYLQHDIVLLDSHFRVCYSNQSLSQQQAQISGSLRRESRINYFSLTEEATVKLAERQLRIIPLMVMYPENKSFIGIFDLEKSTSMQQLQLQQIQNIISLMNSRTDVIKEDIIHRCNDFFVNVLAGKIRQDLIEQQAEQNQIKLTDDCLCAICGLKPAKRGGILFLKQTEQTRRLADWFIDEYAIKAATYILQQQLVLVIAATQNAEHFLKALAAFLKQTIGKQFLLKIGLSHSSLPITKLTKIYQEAQEAYTLAEQSKILIQRFRPKKVSELLQLIPQNEAESFINETLGPLFKIKNKQEAADLIQTLRLYIYNHQQINLVAKQLFIHRNTVVYRLNKTADILGVNFEDPEIIQRLLLALLLYVEK